MSTAINNIDDYYYKPSIKIEDFTQLHFSNIYISLNPSKLIKYEKFLINEISKHFKINHQIIKIIYNNCNIDILNKHNITKQYNYYLTYTILNTRYSSQTIKFSNKTLEHIFEFLSNTKISCYQYDNNSYSNSKNNQYFIFIWHYLKFYLFQINNFIQCINIYSNKIININRKLNQTVNYISFLNQSENKKIINNFLRKKVNTYEINNIIIKFFLEIKELDLEYYETIGFIFTRYDYKNIIYNLYGDRFGIHFIKNNTIKFIDYLLKFNKIDIKYLAETNKIIQLIREKDYDFKKIEEIIAEFKIIMDKIIDNYYDLSLYSHRQKIINDHFHYARNLYNQINKICFDNTIDIIYNLLEATEKYRNKEMIDFILKIATTETYDLIYL